eukprot:350136-Chlamydomonas_euryale.AAC.1
MCNPCWCETGSWGVLGVVIASDTAGVEVAVTVYHRHRCTHVCSHADRWQRGARAAGANANAHHGGVTLSLHKCNMQHDGAEMRWVRLRPPSRHLLAATMEAGSIATRYL